MSIYRIKKDDNYTVIANQPINDKALSFGARGLLVYLLSKPDNWTVRLSDLIAQSPASRTVIRRFISELEKAGYMKRRKYRSDAGTWNWETTVYEVPGDKTNQGTKTTGGLPTDGKPADIVSTDLKSTELTPHEIKLYPLVDSLAKVCLMDGRLNYNTIKKPAGRLLKAGYTAADIERAFGENSDWYKSDWRGQKGQAPTLRQVEEGIKKHLDASTAETKSTPTKTGVRL